MWIVSLYRRGVGDSYCPVCCGVPDRKKSLGKYSYILTWCVDRTSAAGDGGCVVYPDKYTGGLVSLHLSVLGTVICETNLCGLQGVFAGGCNCVTVEPVVINGST